MQQIHKNQGSPVAKHFAPVVAELALLIADLKTPTYDSDELFV